MADLQRMESYQYPATHIGHLNGEQSNALANFKQLCQQKGYWHPAGAGEASHDDETLLRYLRARKFNPQEAFGQFKDTEDWRKENQIDKVYDNIDVSEYEETRRLYPQWIGRRDRRGIPVYVFEVAHVNSKAISAHDASTSKNPSVTAKAPPKMLRLFALYENLTNFVMPLCSQIQDRPYPETPVSQSSNIVDISKVGLKQFWNLKAHMQDASTLATAHYPETLDRIFVIGAPSFFPTVWGWIKKWFDPITVSKIFILSNQNMKSTLEQYIAPENIPRKYGGTLDYNFGDLPNIEPAINDILKWQSPQVVGTKKTIPTGPIRWEGTKGGDLAMVAVGSEHGKKRHTTIASLRAQKSQPQIQAPQSNLKPGEQHDLYRTTSGLDTHPPSPPAGQVEQGPPDDSPPASRNQSIAGVAGMAGVGAAGAGASSGGSYQLPYRNSESREGTSSTRFEQQASTHASDQLASGTPNYRDNGYGDRHGVIEPGTVGQAPKTHNMPPLQQDQQQQPGYLDTAKQYAGEAYQGAAGMAGSAMAAVGYGGQHQQQQPQEERREKAVPNDPRVDNAPTISVEEYLRGQYSSGPAPGK